MMLFCVFFSFSVLCFQSIPESGTNRDARIKATEFRCFLKNVWEKTVCKFLHITPFEPRQCQKFATCLGQLLDSSRLCDQTLTSRLKSSQNCTECLSTRRIFSENTEIYIGWLEFSVPFRHKYGYIRDEKFISYIYVNVTVANKCQTESTENDAQTALDRKWKIRHYITNFTFEEDSCLGPRSLCVRNTVRSSVFSLYPLDYCRSYISCGESKKRSASARN